MRIPRLYQPGPLHAGETLSLDANAARHVTRVLRLRAGDPIVLFNGEGGEYSAELAEIGREETTARVQQFTDRETESPLQLHLAQGISRGERMDYVIQKAVELGVSSLTPLLTERCVVQLRGERLARRLAHWQGVIISACEQCGRNRLPVLHPAYTLMDWLAVAPAGGPRLVLAPHADAGLYALGDTLAEACLLIGPEGGLSETEIQAAQTQGFRAMRLGPRVLRTETAAVSALSALQVMWGDLAQ